MSEFIELLVDNESAAGRLATTAAIIGVAALLSTVVGRLLIRNEDDSYARYYKRKISRYVFAFLAVVAIGVTWRAFAGQAGVVLGLMAAGVAFAMQEVIGALAGWFNIMSGRIFRVGDRIDMGGVRGDVIDITPLRTKILEMGTASSSALSGPSDPGDWVKGRQYTGRIVSVSNKKTFTEPVFNYSAVFEFIWEEITFPIPYRDDWRRAEEVLRREIEATHTPEAEQAMRHMEERYPVPRAEVEPRVFVRATDNWMEISGRFVVPVRTSRRVKDEVTRKVMDALDEAGITIASQTIDATIRQSGGSSTS
ncbi:MAG: mechanosensitive ion channel family protein [Actinomycetota bacterium]|nr:mechanosensitive ion channel family protein [Actinomycetota bacterium]